MSLRMWDCPVIGDRTDIKLGAPHCTARAA